MNFLPEWLDVAPWRERLRASGPEDVEAALAAERPGLRELAVLLSPAAAPYTERLAQQAQALTRRHFGRTIALYAPLYLSNHCASGCAYCGFASDRSQPRRKLSPDEVEAELAALKHMGLEEILLLTGERTPEADVGYVCDCVRLAAAQFALVNVEVFPMSVDEYRQLAEAGATGLTLYQETYDAERYAEVHRWGPKKDFLNRLETPARALEAGLRLAGLGVLLGLADPVTDALRLYRHAVELEKRFWRTGISLAFPRLRPEAGGYHADFAVDDAFLARLICALRLCLPEAHLTLSTREAPRFRDGMAGVGISRMSVASRTTVGGYDQAPTDEAGGFDTTMELSASRLTASQFEVNDRRGVEEFCAALRARSLEPVFKNWDAVYRGGGT
ncbi:MAG: 2-iminoacetate synthase ThiH [Kiritimatiellaeota bacterium]|nr:2-iminoacetate synthase ThiH [Kiritimatiellota bacterium]